ncbi:uncharacterized mitochondrial protein AtMg00810-like [Solanum tuberosum]|uniref:uncharacterized mitochondrial protein AtMg00810-like n=1 Tax=Solanum tuberosum TaxID=4113 RepID=UPI00073A0C40|nr:PREDICTED: uncharacterized mitochondrial protein AtMg00810-like [Solanum tuberosum]
MKDLGELKFFLGIEVARSHEGIVLCKRKYALELISEAGLSGAKPAKTPLETNLKLTSVVYDKAIQHEATTDDELEILLYWGACLETRRSVTCYLVKFGRVLVSWRAKKQETMSRSSAEAEFRSMAAYTAELTWLTGKAAIQIAANPILHERTKHIDIDCYFVRERVSQGMIRTDHVSTTEQLADILTKGLGRVQREYLISKLGLRDIFKPSA